MCMNTFYDRGVEERTVLLNNLTVTVLLHSVIHDSENKYCAPG